VVGQFETMRYRTASGSDRIKHSSMFCGPIEHDCVKNELSV